MVSVFAKSNLFVAGVALSIFGFAVVGQLRAGGCPNSVVRGAYTSVQVNTDVRGCNIVGDAANEPSIAVSVRDPRNIATAWRQFDTLASDFRQAGHAYSHDGGHSWVFPGVLQPGVFRTDPVLDAAPDGGLYYFGFSFGPPTFFASSDGGRTWEERGELAGFDKPWMTVDRSDGVGRGNIYVWGASSKFWRSSNSGTTFESFVTGAFNSIPLTLAVQLDGTLIVAAGGVAISVSRDAQYAASEPTFEYLGYAADGWYGSQIGIEPNPCGLMGQTWVATDHSQGTTRGNVYLLGTVRVGSFAQEDLDVWFVRSNDGGVTWSEVVRVNDDPVTSGAYQWFAMMSVASNGRIDAVWNDTRNSGQANLSELYYSFSTDAGGDLVGERAGQPDVR